MPRGVAMHGAWPQPIGTAVRRLSDQAYRLIMGL